MGPYRRSISVQSQGRGSCVMSEPLVPGAWSGSHTWGMLWPDTVCLDIALQVFIFPGIFDPILKFVAPGQQANIINRHLVVCVRCQYRSCLRRRYPYFFDPGHVCPSFRSCSTVNSIISDISLSSLKNIRQYHKNWSKMA